MPLGELKARALAGPGSPDDSTVRCCGQAYLLLARWFYCRGSSPRRGLRTEVKAHGAEVSVEAEDKIDVLAAGDYETRAVGERERLIVVTVVNLPGRVMNFSRDPNKLADSDPLGCIDRFM